MINNQIQKIYTIRYTKMPILLSPVDQVELVILLDGEIAAGGKVPYPHGMQPIDEATSPLGPRELQSPERPRLAHHASALVDD